MDLLATLNPPQRTAVTHQEGPLLILAGAGSGKTRVITHRIAHLIHTEVAYPEQILAVTFTNKASDEMRERVDLLLTEIGRPEAAPNVTISTFHSLGARLLRRHADRLGLSWSFQIYDDVDQYKLVRELLQARDMETDASSVRRMCSYIERMKNMGFGPKRAHEIAHNQTDEESAWFYEDYQDALRQANCLDFGDLILGVLEVFRDDASLAASYSHQWRFPMVDEFQDTNPAQYELLQHLTSEHNNLCVVGDDDQAIYRWRGATVANILGFEHDYEDTEVIKLEQNYRSTQLILDAADDVIRHNPSRRDKKLWTETEGGEPISLFTGNDGREEAQYVAEKIRVIAATQDLEWRDFAVFFRTNAQARLFEEQLRFAGVPYQIVGGTSFYRRAEIKDVLAYLKVALNPENQVDLLRVINVPSRGVGAATTQKLLDGARIPGIDTVYDAVRFVLGADFTFEGELKLIEPAPTNADEDEALIALEEIRTAQVNGLRDFHETIQTLRDDLLHFESLAEILRQFIERINYFAHLSSKHPESAEDKTRNVAELVSAIEEFERDFDEDAAPEGVFKAADLIDESSSLLSDATAVRQLRAFLDQSALTQSPEDAEEAELHSEEGRVTLMTVHGSKGLEFENVFLVGMEDDLFPSIRDPNDAEEVQEERRLAYVAITRAKRRLFISNARRRRLYGSFKENMPSRFLLDIEPERITIDAKSVVDVIDWGKARRKKLRGKQLTDEDIYFSDGQVADASFNFDQSAEELVLDPAIDTSDADAEHREGVHGHYDEFSQVGPSDWEDSFGGSASAAASSSPASRARDLSGEELVGHMVTHSRYGIGEVRAVSGEGDKASITVHFPTAGSKTIVRKFLKVIG